jgi:acyl-CoA thioesterase
MPTMSDRAQEEQRPPADPAAALDAARRLHASDPAMQTAGIEFVHAASGRAQLRLVVHPAHLNAAGTVHGGILFLLADSAFAVACNNEGVPHLAAAASIEFLRPAGAGVTLTATAQRTAGKVYDVLVSDDQGRTVAVFRGRASAPTRPA